MKLMNANAVAVSTCHGRSTATGAVRRLAWDSISLLDPMWPVGPSQHWKEKNRKGNRVTRVQVARPAGLEPATSWFVAVTDFVDPAQLTSQRTAKWCATWTQRWTQNLMEAEPRSKSLLGRRVHVPAARQSARPI